MNSVSGRRRIGVAILTVGATAVLCGPVLAQVTDINSVVIQNRRFNDYPNSTLVTVNTYPTVVSFTEGPFGAGGFANQHLARFSTNGTTARSFLNSEAFDISFNVNLAVGSTGPRKEAGFRMDTFIAGESFFFVTSDGEVAAFGGPFPFFSFGTSAYTPGTTANLRMIYQPGANATLEYIYNGLSSGALDFGNLEEGIINGSDMATYVQNQPNDNNSGDFSNVAFTNYSVAVPVPEPMSIIGIAAGIGILLKRRRKQS